MKRSLMFAALLGLSFTVAACGDDESPTAPSQPTTIVFTAALSTANEVPPITNAEQAGRGNSTMTFHLTRDAAGAITAATVDFNASYNSFPPGTILTLSHIHTGASGVNGAVLINTAIAAGEVTMPNGAGTLVRNGVVVTPVDVANQIINNPAAFYFNSHTGLNPGGVVRGQLVRSD